MKKKLLLASVFVGAAFFVNGQEIFMAAGQENTNYINFKEVRTLNTNTFEQEKVFFSKASLTGVSQKTKTSDCNCDPASVNYIASIAVDNNGNIVTMNMTGTKVFKYSDNNVVTIDVPSTQKWTEQDLFARMTTTPDGSIYALNNIGSELLKISADNTVTSLGAVSGFDAIFRGFADARSSYGGDMVADENGNLYVITAFANVVKIDASTLAAEYIGQLAGLPEGYMVNGAAVLENNTILLASSLPKGLYTTDFSSLKASYYGENTTPTYDLASKKFLKNGDSKSEAASSFSVTPTLIKQEKYFNIVSATDLDDKATIGLYSVEGKMVSSQSRILKTGENKINVDGFATGVYLVKVTDINGKELLTTKVNIQ